MCTPENTHGSKGTIHLTSITQHSTLCGFYCLLAKSELVYMYVSAPIKFMYNVHIHTYMYAHGVHLLRCL